jgi:hypothetical protein
MLCSKSINGLKLFGGAITDFVGYTFSLIIGELLSEEESSPSSRTMRK